ncbi:MAG TPA: flagellar motor protein MotB [Bryobacteraceae bacterium]|nr:flagellar motor protein MotB [Bryobacteraceae bacterium]
MSHLKPKYLQAETARDRWMVSYMDVLTILLIFFVALAAQSLERPKEKQAPKTVAAAVPPKTPEPAPPSVPEARQKLLDAQKALEQHGLDLRMEPRGLVISIPQAVLFPSGADQVSRHALPIVAQIAGVLHDIPNGVSLVGHADAVPIHNRRFKSNWDLATARSLNLLAVLSRRYGIAESRLSVASYGPYRPSGPNDTPEGRAQNRRVEIVILDETAPL